MISSGDLELAKQQLGFVPLGLLIFVCGGLIDYRWLKKIALPLFILLVLSLLMVKLVGVEVRGSVRWLEIGSLRFQPSEFAKVLFIIVVSTLLSGVAPNRLSLKRLIPVAFIILIPTFLVFIQPDFGTSLIFILVGSALIFSAGIQWRILIPLALLGLTGLPFIWNLLRDYQKDRLLVFLNPDKDPLGAGYNVIQAIIAVGSGRMWGRGFGRGPQSQLRFLPEQHTDFIFATLAEEWGMIGVMLLFTLLFLLVLRIHLIALRSSDSFGVYLCLGVGYLLMSQILINIGMNVGIMPVTGLPLPFVSYGGSALLSYSFALAIVHSVALHSRS